jgi:hypothetical protein
MYQKPTFDDTSEGNYRKAGLSHLAIHNNRVKLKYPNKRATHQIKKKQPEQNLAFVYFGRNLQTATNV